MQQELLKEVEKNYEIIKKSLLKKKVINVLFFCTDIEKWKYQRLYELIKKDKAFNTQVAVSIPYCKDFREKEYKANCDYFKSKNISFYECYVPEKNEFIPLEKFNPDIIFFEEPYANHVMQAPEHCSKFALCYYVPYCLPDQTENIEYGLDFHLLVDKFYLLNDSTKELYSKKMQNKGKNLVVVGHPDLDYYHLTKNEKTEKKYVIYAPHHSIQDVKTNFSTFLWSGKLILDWAKKHPEINWIYRPHPYLRVTLKNFMSEEEITNYNNEWAKIAMVSQGCEYQKLFTQSYAMITDSGSFLTEYFATGQPVIHMRREDSVPFNETVTKISDAYYKAYNETELTNALEKVLVEKNDILKEKRLELLNSLDFYNKDAAQNIIDDIKNDFPALKKDINIAFSCNNEWMDKLAVTIVSILKHANLQDTYHFYILDSNISEFNKNKIAQIKSKVNFDINYLKVDKNLFKNAPLTHHIKIETYFRLSLPNIIDIDKLLYIDVDTLILKDIGEIYNIDIKNYYAAVVEDVLSKEKKIHKLNVKKYFNAGVLLLNLKKIREDKLEKDFFDTINNHTEIITWPDQCVLNHCFKENVIFLDKKYNFQHTTETKNINKTYKKIKNDIIILHFVSGKKPWNLQKSWNLNLLYYYYFLQTPYKNNFLKNIFCQLNKKLNLTFLLLKP